jgi:hypothetical protein
MSRSRSRHDEIVWPVTGLSIGSNRLTAGNLAEDRFPPNRFSTSWPFLIT